LALTERQRQRLAACGRRGARARGRCGRRHLLRAQKRLRPSYHLKFTTAAPGGAPQPFPRWVTVTAVAGAAVMPAVPPITHDGIGRGLAAGTFGFNTTWTKGAVGTPAPTATFTNGKFDITL
jgi:hypothetical protein